MSPFLRTILVASLALLTNGPARADLVSPYGGETAPNFVEISVLDDRVRLALEIDPADYPYFVAPDENAKASLAERTGRTVQVSANGQPLSPVIRTVDLRPRQPRATATTVAVPPRPRSDDVIYAEMEFPFTGQPESITFTPPLDMSGMPVASLGLLVDHLGVPVTDYRYLSRAETLVPDWEDPWFSAFENPNLTRHHKSPLMSFLSMEPREVRHEIIVRLRDLEGWVELDLDATGSLGSAQMAEVAPRAADFFERRNPVVIDGEAVVPVDIRVSRIAVGAQGLRVLEDGEQSDRATALLGIVLAYPRTTLASDVEMTWDLFPEGIDTVPVTLTDPAGGVPAVVRRDDSVVSWTNHLTSWTDPKPERVTVSTAKVLDLPVLAGGFIVAAFAAAWTAFRNKGTRRIAAATVCVAGMVAAAIFAPRTTPVQLPGQPGPDAEATQHVMAGLLENAGTAMLETRPDQFELALAPFVRPERANDVGAEMRRGLSVTLPSGALARTDEIVDIEVEQVTPESDGNGSQILATWTASVSGGHWGHLHRRLVTYRGLIDVSRQADQWFLNGLTILSAQTRT
ncbi:hypothetical protein CLV78_1011049 [Aliiruegeria haliotis]|uniref:Oxygen tolerance protein BatD n=1 Tax=Aliiruegeria haliotis TaxID=1280846 RepID=A0A2T0S0J1_9RHOB|nr:hypothetical protein [Aliiruegeria haliotis]PRY26944.1 hypothetical protein CLV78_1011049 [Aliiruegeria haliotis]